MAAWRSGSYRYSSARQSFRRAAVVHLSAGAEIFSEPVGGRHHVLVQAKGTRKPGPLEYGKNGRSNDGRVRGRLCWQSGTELRAPYGPSIRRRLKSGLSLLLSLATARSIFLTWPYTHVPPTNMLLTKRQRLTAVKRNFGSTKKIYINSLIFDNYYRLSID